MSTRAKLGQIAQKFILFQNYLTQVPSETTGYSTLEETN